MRSNWRVTWFKPVKVGVEYRKNSVSFAAEMFGDQSPTQCGVILYDIQGEEHRFPFQREGKRGSLYGLKIEGEGLEKCSYNFYKGEEIITDPYARKVSGLEIWGGDSGQTRRETRAFLAEEEFDWQGDEPLKIPPEKSIFYGLNVRAFTMHKSSGVKERGTFEGLIEKIPYLRELGITAVELMPCYEYDERMAAPEPLSGSEISMSVFSKEVFEDKIQEKSPDKEEAAIRLNCWGFQKGFYFTPKASYSACGCPVTSFKRLIRDFHKNGLEVIMHFYFPPEIRQMQMLEVIRYWVIEYHIDGVRLSGFHIPYRLIAEEPVLKNTKIRCSYVPREDLSVIKNPLFKNFLTDNGNFRNDMRRFLKGDEGLINQALAYQRCNPPEHGVVNYMADYDGFSLYDSVCYERKHNEANGEDNRDGADMNYTWNCGVEGESRKKGIRELRLKQIKNALAFVFLSQGVPFLFGGDEFANSRDGNNNCYCQDNETGWVKWRKNSFSEDVLAFTKFLINLRKANAILHMKDEFLVMDSIGCGFPDISYHGVEAWRPDMSFISRIAGIVLCGEYAPDKKDSFYIACNMHWESHELALPKLSRNKRWVKIMDTSLPAGELNEEGIFPESSADTSSGKEKEDSLKKESVITLRDRSIAVFKTVKGGEKTARPVRKYSEGKKPEE